VSMINRRHSLTLASAALAAPALLGRAFAEAWPKGKIIRAVVPFAAGSTIDVIGRIVLDPTQGVEPMPLSPLEFDAVIAKEIISNVELAKAAGLKFN
jgi:tripartite-type tricarboxylate transporter receptor subunit TctC